MDGFFLKELIHPGFDEIGTSYFGCSDVKTVGPAA